MLLLQETNASSTYNDNHYLLRDMPVIGSVAVIKELLLHFFEYSMELNFMFYKKHVQNFNRQQIEDNI